MNAVEAMSAVTDGSRDLLISTSEVEPGSVLVAESISDPGMPANPEHLFEALYTTKAGGLGMVLTICRSITQTIADGSGPRRTNSAALSFAMPLPVERKIA